MEPEIIDMSIVITKEKEDDEEYVDVSGLYNNPKNVGEKYSQGIELVPWRKWLGMDMSKESLKNYLNQEIVVRCLYEMTFLGFNEKEIRKNLKR